MNSILRNVNQIPALFTFKLDLAKEYQPFIYDLIRMAIIHTMINILSHAANPSEIELFGSNYFTILCFILIGVSTYWLIVNKLFRFQFNDAEECESKENVVVENENKNNTENTNENVENDNEKKENNINDVLANDEAAEKNASC